MQTEKQGTTLSATPPCSWAAVFLAVICVLVLSFTSRIFFIIISIHNMLKKLWYM